MQQQSGHDLDIDYVSESDMLWSNAGAHSARADDASNFADLILKICGIGPVLDAGCGRGELVNALLRRGIDARGVDISGVVVALGAARLPSRVSPGNMLDLPFADGSFRTVVANCSIESLAPDDVARALSEIYRVSQRFVVLKIATSAAAASAWRRTSEGRAFWETRCFEAGFRKHPLFYDVNAYESLNSDGDEILIPLEKISPAANRKYPLGALREERDLHMDMLREHGSRSDAHVGRYHFAARYVRPGDVVLDAACGLGYGSYVIHNSTQCSRVTGIDGSTYGVDYATTNYALADRVSYVEGYLPDCLVNIPDQSIDTIVCFETLEHVEAPTELLREFHRILTPGGRLIASVPHDWSDETGEDPNPFHLHVYDRKKFLNQLSADFDMESLFGQTADRIKKPGGKCEWLVRPRSLDELDAQSKDAPVEAEWLLAVACKSPVGAANVFYEEHMFSPGERDASGDALAFARDYENPWLVRAIVSIGLRTENARLREKWALATLEHASPRSADRGAALCILAYLLLKRDVGMDRHELIGAIDGYLAGEPANPNALRWQVSLRYVRALIELDAGNRAKAAQFLQQVIDSPSARYSPTLLTKPAEAALLLGSMRAADGDIEQARSIWETNFRAILEAVADHFETPYRAAPPKFELREIAHVVSFAGRLATASGHAFELPARPAVFRELSADDVAMHIDSLIKGKAWLDTAWRASVKAIEEQQVYLVQLVEGKDWLEEQWRSGQTRIAAQDAQLQQQADAFAQRLADLETQNEQRQAHLAQLVEGKDWLEEQWRSGQSRIAAQDAQLQEQAETFARLEQRHEALLETNRQLESQLREASDRAQRLAATLPLRLARKLGMYNQV